jgi:hypothetical protein
MNEKKIRFYSTDEEGRALIHPNGEELYFCGEPEDNSFFRDHHRAIDELNLLLNALNKYGGHLKWCNALPSIPRLADAEYVCNCGWVGFEKVLLIPE